MTEAHVWDVEGPVQVPQPVLDHQVHATREDILAQMEPINDS